MPVTEHGRPAPTAASARQHNCPHLHDRTSIGRFSPEVAMLKCCFFCSSLLVFNPQPCRSLAVVHVVQKGMLLSGDPCMDNAPVAATLAPPSHMVSRSHALRTIEVPTLVPQHCLPLKAVSVPSLCCCLGCVRWPGPWLPVYRDVDVQALVGSIGGGQKRRPGAGTSIPYINSILTKILKNGVKHSHKIELFTPAWHVPLWSDRVLSFKVPSICTFPRMPAAKLD